MAKLEMPVIELLYAYGKDVYEGKISLEEATDLVLQKYPDGISKASAQFYIGLYGSFLSGKGGTWNQNGKLVMYYAEHILEEQGIDAAKNAYKAGMKIARAGKKQDLKQKLDAFWKQLSTEEPPFVSDFYEDEFTDWLQNNSGKQYTENTIRRYSRALRNVEEWFHISLDKPIMSIADVTSLDKATTKIKALPDYKEVNQNHGHGDLSAAMTLYRQFLQYKWHGTFDPVEDQEDIDDEEDNVMTVKETIAAIGSYIAARGFQYPAGLIENFYLSLKSKPFVILAGTSGTGKTRLVKLFAEAIGARYYLVSVRPDWSDGSDLFGHRDLNGKPVPGPVYEAFKAAVENPTQPVLLCLDEMNLARVEYYLSDVLSVIESREWGPDGRIVTSIIAPDIADQLPAYKAGIPDNLYIVGTVNMDETTFPFSKKVLDRANTIEFNYVDLTPSFETTETLMPLALKNEFLRGRYLVLATDCREDAEYVNKECAELLRINQILQRANAHVGYRVRDEIVYYMLNNQKADNLIERDDAFDNEIMQKILPRIQGSTNAVKDMLVELFKICAADSAQMTADSESERMQKVLDSTSIHCIYRKSAQKIRLMVRRFEEDGFTSYWL